MNSPRIKPMDPDDYSEDLKQFLAGLVDKGVSPAIGQLNVVRTLAHHPQLAVSYMTFGTYVLGRSSLPTAVRELVTLRTAWLSGSEYEWGHHAARARRAGMSEADIEGTKVGSAADHWSELDRHVVLAVEQLRSDTRMSDEVWETLGRHLDQDQMLDLIFTVGCYAMLAMAINTLQVEDES